MKHSYVNRLFTLRASDRLRSILNCKKVMYTYCLVLNINCLRQNWSCMKTKHCVSLRGQWSVSKNHMCTKLMYTFFRERLRQLCISHSLVEIENWLLPPALNQWNLLWSVCGLEEINFKLTIIKHTLLQTFSRHISFKFALKLHCVKNH